MEPLSRMTGATVDVLTSLIGCGGATWGLRIVKDSLRPPGTVYPLLDRLERAGWVRSEWEDDPARTGPRRRLYELTAGGALAARAAVAAFASTERLRAARAAGAGA
ncbi:MAG: helix-turn-helix transcriptional regulator [Burkholderiaceae bacterium]|nr:helix-turn-helix transcriptional regulator [Microbacteriaceae bacterium]